MLSRAEQKPGSYGLTGKAGLQLKPKSKLLKAPQRTSAASSLFSAEADDAADAAEAQLRRKGTSRQAEAAAAAAAAAALAADPSVYDYDGVYDSMAAQRDSTRVVVGRPKAERSARYITSIMESHKEREIENDKLFERKMVKEAEEEAHLYGDKERFVTSAYRKKLEARQEYEEARRREAEREAREDVTRRGDLTHFHRNLLDGALAQNRGDGAAQGGASAARAAPSAGKGGGDGVGDGRGQRGGDGGRGGGARTSVVGDDDDDEDDDGGGGGGDADRALRGDVEAPPTPPLEDIEKEAGDRTHAGTRSGETAGGKSRTSADAHRDGARSAAGADEAVFKRAIASAASALSRKPAPGVGAAAAEQEAAATAAAAAARRNDEAAVLSARERYLQRKKQKMGGGDQGN